MLAIIGLIIAYISSLWFAMWLMKNGGNMNRNKLMVVASIGFPSAIYVTLAYVLGLQDIPGNYLEPAIFFMSVGIFGVNAGRVIMSSSLMNLCRKEEGVWGKIILFYTFLETGAIFELLMFILAWVAFANNDWSSLLQSPDYFVPGMIVLSIMVLLGGVFVGWSIKYSITKTEEEGKDFKSEGFKNALIYSSFPQLFWIFGLLISLLTYMGEFQI